VSNRAAEILVKDINELRIVTAHLGNGCSMAAVKYGQSIDTTMGFTPLEGLMMGTRSGDLDPSLILYIMGKEGLSLHEAGILLNKHSGLTGISGESSDMREILAAVKDEHKRARYAFEMFCYRIKKYFGAYAVAMGGVDVFVFTGGIGENSVDVRTEVCRDLEFLGLKLDEQRNEDSEEIISSDSSAVKVMRITTNEELVIAMDTDKIVSEMLQSVDQSSL
jgi:acetate kinase